MSNPEKLTSTPRTDVKMPGGWVSQASQAAVHSAWERLAAGWAEASQEPGQKPHWVALSQALQLLS